MYRRYIVWTCVTCCTFCTSRLKNYRWEKSLSTHEGNLKLPAYFSLVRWMSHALYPRSSFLIVTLTAHCSTKLWAVLRMIKPLRVVYLVSSSGARSWLVTVSWFPTERWLEVVIEIFCGHLIILIAIVSVWCHHDHSQWVVSWGVSSLPEYLPTNLHSWCLLVNWTLSWWMIWCFSKLSGEAIPNSLFIMVGGECSPIYPLI